MRGRISLVSLVVLLVGCSGCPPLIYRDPPLHGKVVEAETGRPIEGAVVLAARKMKWNPTLVPYELEETETGPDGNYDIAGGTLRYNLPGRRFEPGDLTVLVLRRGRAVGRFENKEADGATLTWGRNGESLPLDKSEATKDEVGLRTVAEGCARTQHAPLKRLYTEIQAMISQLPEAKDIDPRPCMEQR